MNEIRIEALNLAIRSPFALPPSSDEIVARANKFLAFIEPRTAGHSAVNDD